MHITLKDLVAIWGAFTGTIGLALTLFRAYKNREKLSFSKQPICYSYKDDYKYTMEEMDPDEFYPHVGFVVDIVIDNPVDSSVTITDIKAYTETELVFEHLSGKPELAVLINRDLSWLALPEPLELPRTISAHSSIQCSIHFRSYDTVDIDKISEPVIEFITHKKKISKHIDNVRKSTKTAE
ncbi:hypothetical protein [Erysipelothrix anatis]|uniref:hypothetical protein n=1 Tax=Erysipelothrix anatis TaxID=2683713 RepID=UPI0013578764|nr:hypothetical protein [Erysipelothrix anatis]